MDGDLTPGAVALGAGFATAAGGAIWEIGVAGGDHHVASAGILLFYAAAVVLLLALGAAVVSRIR